MSTHQTVYLVRHGLTEGNIAGTVQGHNDPLAPLGHRQAERLAARAQHLKFDHLLASDMVRAQQTAEYIARATRHRIIPQPLLREVWRSTELVGIEHTSDLYKAFLAEDQANFGNPDWRYQDAENFTDIKARALQTLDYFASFGTETVLAVTHGHFIRVLVATVFMNGKLTPEVWAEAGRSMRTHNTGITILRRDSAEARWELLAVNDHSHFADE